MQSKKENEKKSKFYKHLETGLGQQSQAFTLCVSN